MRILHVCAGWQHWNGAANIARMIMDEQRREGHTVSLATWAKIRDLRTADTVWIHCGWLPCLWWAAFWAQNAQWMPEACYDPIRLKFSAWKKRLVGPIERWALRRCKKIVATCEAEKAWIEAYLGKMRPEIVVEDVKRFFDLNRAERAGNDGLDKKLHVLYLGRRHPLKGVVYLEKAVDELNEDSRSRELKLNSEIGGFSNEENLSVHRSPSTSNFDSKQIDLRIVSDAKGEELERVWDWCDVLVLPTLSENFGLVVAEALERGRRVITTDGAPAWESSVSGGSGAVVSSEFGVQSSRSGICSGYGGRLLYLKGYKDGSARRRVELLKNALSQVIRK